MTLRFMSIVLSSLVTLSFIPLVSCNNPASKETASVLIRNDFNNPSLDRRPPWTICKCNYRGVDFGKVPLGDSTAAKEVDAGLDYVLMVASWNDTACSTHHCLPIASKMEEEVVEGQARTITINAPNHQGPCPPEGVQPIPEALYNRILALWPEFGFKPYAERAQNPQCQ